MLCYVLYKKIGIKMESQAHGFKFEDIVLNNIFDNKIIIDAINFWKSKDYTAIFDIPEYKYLLKYQKEHNIIPSFTEQEYLSSLKLDIKLPISIKSTKQSKSPRKKIEFGDIQRTIKNFSLYDVKEFSIIIIEYKQIEDKKRIMNTIVLNMDKNNYIIKDITKFAKSKGLKNIEAFTPIIKSLKPGFIDTKIKAAYRLRSKTILLTQESLTGHIKIDSKKQRRIQCSIKKSSFFESQTEKDIYNNELLNKWLCKDKVTEISSSSRKLKRNNIISQ